MSYFNDPARLIDCPYCDYQMFPEDDYCGNGHKNESDFKKKLDEIEEKINNA